jgi:hypothetical protein
MFHTSIIGQCKRLPLAVVLVCADGIKVSPATDNLFLLNPWGLPSARLNCYELLRMRACARGLTRFAAWAAPFLQLFSIPATS